MELLYHDNCIAVCVKPAGALSTDEPGGVPDMVRAALGDPAADVRTVHRLDRVVGGVMLLALSRDAAVVDPPRKGLAPEVIATVAEMAPGRAVYVSCDPATLARDVALLREKGYALEKVEAFDMFPRTNHCETVVNLSRTEA